MLLIPHWFESYVVAHRSSQKLMPNNGCCPTCGTRNLRAGSVPTLHTPRIKQLISTNEPPLDFEEVPLRDIVNQGPRVLSDLDTKIADVNDILQ